MHTETIHLRRLRYVNQCYYSAPERVRSIVMNVSVCLSVCLCESVSLCVCLSAPIFPVHVACKSVSGLIYRIYSDRQEPL